MKKILLFFTYITIPTMMTAQSKTHQIGFNDYVYTVPTGWLSQNNGDHTLLQNPQSGCLIRILPPSPSSGNLEEDVKAVFNLMYAGWQYRNTGEKQFLISKGLLVKGLPYCMLEGEMSMTDANGQRTDQDGAAVVIGVNGQIVILSIRHNTGMLSHSDCLRKYESYKKFFDSFTVKNAATTNEEDIAKRIVGRWKIKESMAVSDYVFGANGHFQHGGAIGTSSTSSDDRYDYTHYKSYSFEGHGSYSVAYHQLTLTKKGDTSPRVIQIRFASVNAGDIGWRDRMYMLQRDVAGEFEVCYEKVRE